MYAGAWVHNLVVSEYEVPKVWFPKSVKFFVKHPYMAQYDRPLFHGKPIYNVKVDCESDPTWLCVKFAYPTNEYFNTYS